MSAAKAIAGYDLVHARLLHRYPELVAQLGGDAQSLLNAAGIGGRYGGPASYQQIATLLERTAEALACPDLGLRLARLQGGRSVFGPLGEVMMRASTFGDAVRYVVRHSFAHSLAARVWLRPLPDGAAFVGHDVLLHGVAERGQLIEQVLLLGHLAALDITGGHARARRVTLRHRPALPLRAVRRYFGCEVAVDERADGVEFSAADLRRPILGSDREAYERATAFVDARFTQQRLPLHAEVRGAVMRMIGGASCTNERVSAALSLHSRTLLRRLRAEGTSFQAIKNEVRRDIALYYLQHTDLELACISEKLGFSEQSVMTRRCRQWFGATPSQVRAGLPTAPRASEGLSE